MKFEEFLLEVQKRIKKELIINEIQSFYDKLDHYSSEDHAFFDCYDYYLIISDFVIDFENNFKSLIYFYYKNKFENTVDSFINFYKAFIDISDLRRFLAVFEKLIYNYIIINNYK